MLEKYLKYEFNQTTLEENDNILKRKLYHMLPLTNQSDIILYTTLKFSKLKEKYVTN